MINIHSYVFLKLLHKFIHFITNFITNLSQTHLITKFLNNGLLKNKYILLIKIILINSFKA